MTTPIFKKCSHCSIDKELSEFSISRRAPSGLSCRCKECDKSYYLKNRSKKLEYFKKYNHQNLQHLKEYKKQYYLKNKKKLDNKNKVYREQHKDQLCIYHRNYKNSRKQIDLNYKLTMLLRSRLYHAIKGQTKSGSAIRDLGCTIEQLKIYLESKFQEGMTWNNWSHKGWHIDHIIPLSKVDLSNRKDFLKVCHYTNLQPMWAIDNLSKHAKWI